MIRGYGRACAIEPGAAPDVEAAHGGENLEKLSGAKSHLSHRGHRLIEIHVVFGHPLDGESSASLDTALVRIQMYDVVEGVAHLFDAIREEACAPMTDVFQQRAPRMSDHRSTTRQCFQSDKRTGFVEKARDDDTPRTPQKIDAFSERNRADEAALAVQPRNDLVFVVLHGLREGRDADDPARAGAR